MTLAPLLRLRVLRCGVSGVGHDPHLHCVGESGADPLVGIHLGIARNRFSHDQ